ncbi:hypothetical protein ACQJBY_022381 [Aegilops geniculata]
MTSAQTNRCELNTSSLMPSPPDRPTLAPSGTGPLRWTCPSSPSMPHTRQKGTLPCYGHSLCHRHWRDSARPSAPQGERSYQWWPGLRINSKPIWSRISTIMASHRRRPCCYNIQWCGWRVFHNEVSPNLSDECRPWSSETLGDTAAGQLRLTGVIYAQSLTLIVYNFCSHYVIPSAMPFEGPSAVGPEVPSYRFSSHHGIQALMLHVFLGSSYMGADAIGFSLILVYGRTWRDSGTRRTLSLDLLYAGMDARWNHVQSRLIRNCIY